MFSENKHGGFVCKKGFNFTLITDNCLTFDSFILQFIGLGLVYNLDKKTLEEMNTALGRNAEADNAVAENINN